MTGALMMNGDMEEPLQHIVFPPTPQDSPEDDTTAAHITNDSDAGSVTSGVTSLDGQALFQDQQPPTSASPNSQGAWENSVL